jgi:hypothetical protein
MPGKVRAGYARHGAAALLVGPLSGIPYKLYAVEAPGRLALTTFLLVSVPARLERLAITWAMFVPFGLFLRPRLRHPAPVLLGVWALYWIAVYSVYWRLV